MNRYNILNLYKYTFHQDSIYKRMQIRTGANESNHVPVMNVGLEFALLFSHTSGNLLKCGKF